MCCTEGEDGVDLESLSKKLYSSIVKREYLETRHNTVEDDGFIGLLNLMCNILKHNPIFKTSKEGQDFLSQVFINNLYLYNFTKLLSNTEFIPTLINYLDTGLILDERRVIWKGSEEGMR